MSDFVYIIGGAVAVAALAYYGIRWKLSRDHVEHTQSDARAVFAALRKTGMSEIEVVAKLRETGWPESAIQQAKTAT
jgi:hypothetical protein